VDPDVADREALKLAIQKFHKPYQEFVRRQQQKISKGLKDTFVLDLNKFLKTNDAMRVLLWRPVEG
jgi:hypothetical protein